MSTSVASPAAPRRGRAWLSGLLITLAVITTPTAIVANWATMQTTDTQLFVKTLGPLASNPTVQAAIVDEVTTQINDVVNVNHVTSSIIDGFGSALGLPSDVKKALGFVSEPIASGVKGLIEQVVTDFVKSPAFADAWTRVLTVTQKQAVALLSGDPNSMFKITSDGTLTMPLKPIIVEIKKSLVDQGVQIASIIPEVDKDITIGQVPELAMARVIYQIGTGIGMWLPWITFLAFVIGIAVANRRPRALVGTGFALIAVTGVMLVGFSTGSLFLPALVQPPFGAAAGVVFDAVVLYARDVAGAVLTVAIVMILTGWALSPSAARARAWLSGRFDAGRAGLDQVGATMGKTGRLLGTQVNPIRWLIVAIGVIAVAFIRPLTPGSVITGALLVLLALTLFELLWRRPQSAPAKAPAAAKAPSATKAPAAKKTAPKKSTQTSTSKSTGGTSR
jgi:hypothetical protein